MSPQQQLLQDEARAWREIARQVERRGLLGVGLCREIKQVRRHLPVGLAIVMYGRVEDHLDGRVTMRDVEPCGPTYDVINERQESADNRVLASLFLALEAEDELKALTPVSRPSSLRRPRQHKRGK